MHASRWAALRRKDRGGQYPLPVARIAFLSEGWTRSRRPSRLSRAALRRTRARRPDRSSGASAMTATAAEAFATPRPAARAVRCPHCDKPPAMTFRTRDEIAAELAMRDAFFARRLAGHRSRDELRDLTDVLL